MAAPQRFGLEKDHRPPPINIDDPLAGFPDTFAALPHLANFVHLRDLVFNVRRGRFNDSRPAGWFAAHPALNGIHREAQIIIPLVRIEDSITVWARRIDSLA